MTSEERRYARPLEHDPWQPIESAPKDGRHVLIGKTGEWSCEGYFDDERKEWFAANEHWTDSHSQNLHPTHWMSLPPAPEIEHG